MREVMMRAQALAEAIVESEIYKTMHSLEDQVTKDEKATALIAAYMEKRNDVELLLRSPEFDAEKVAAAGEELQNALKLRQQRHCQNMLSREFLHRIQTMFDFLLVDQRLLDPGTQQAAAHCRGRLIQQRKQRPFLTAPADRFRQLQVASCVAIQKHSLTALVNTQLGDMFQRILLRLGQVLHQRACSASSRLILLRQTKGRQIVQVKMTA